MKTQNLHSKKLLLGCLLLIGIFAMPEVFAQNAQAGTCSESLSKLLTLLYNLQYFFSRVWLILANLVGKLMTNAFVYGEFLNLDTFLWQIWQISRNLANLAIGGYFLYAILKFLISPSEKDANPKSLVKDMLFAGVMVQASWFIVMVIVDVSSILFATVSAVPSQLIADDLYLDKSLSKSIEGEVSSSASKTNNDPLSYWQSKVVKVYINNNEASTTIRNKHQEKKYKDTTYAHKDILAIEVVDRDPANPPPSKEEMFDNLLPKHNSLSGPLMYLGLSMFKTFEFVKASPHQGVNCNDTMMKDLIIYLLHWGMIMLYTLALFVLAIILIGRVAYLWIFIAISPIVFLLKFFKVFKAPGKDLFWDLEKMISLIFQPVRFALFIGLMMVMLITLSGLFRSSSDKNLGDGFKISSTENSSVLEAGNLLSVGLRNTALTFDNLFLGAISLLCMWWLVKMAAESKTGIETLDKFVENTTKFAQKAITTTPLIPTPVGKVGLGTFYDPERGDSPLLTAKKNAQESKFSAVRAEQNKAVLNFFGKEESVLGLSATNATKLKQISNSSSASIFADYKKAIQEIRKERSIGYVDVENTLYTVLQKQKNWTNSSVAMQTLGSKLANLSKPDEIKKHFESNTLDFQTLYKELFGEATSSSLEKIKDSTNPQYRLPQLSN